MKRSKRFAVLAQRPVNQDGLIGEWPEEGLIAMDSPFDPVSSVKVDNGLIVELDGKRRDQFDMIDRFTPITRSTLSAQSRQCAWRRWK